MNRCFSFFFVILSFSHSSKALQRSIKTTVFVVHWEVQDDMTNNFIHSLLCLSRSDDFGKDNQRFFYIFGENCTASWWCRCACSWTPPWWLRLQRSAGLYWCSVGCPERGCDGKTLTCRLCPFSLFLLSLLQDGIVNPTVRKDMKGSQKLYCCPIEGCPRGANRPFSQFSLVKQVSVGMFWGLF